ncbi:hypothetical protein EV363DRAFT_1265692 [Boletus edulis]|nr:hypothetical protein EV363DRAFT_1265692 [Boletus edulis]
MLKGRRGQLEIARRLFYKIFAIVVKIVCDFMFMFSMHLASRNLAMMEVLVSNGKYHKFRLFHGLL